MNASLEESNLPLDYPCRWRYQVIGSEEDRLRRAIAAAVVNHRHTVTVARSSRTGKYCSLHVELVVIDEAHRNGIFTALREHADVNFVL